MRAKVEKKKRAKRNGITFKCKICESSKPLDEMTVLTRFFSPLIACRECERKMR